MLGFNLTVTMTEPVPCFPAGVEVEQLERLVSGVGAERRQLGFEGAGQLGAEVCRQAGLLPLEFWGKVLSAQSTARRSLAPPAGIEPATCGFGKRDLLSSWT